MEITIDNCVEKIVFVKNSIDFSHFSDFSNESKFSKNSFFLTKTTFFDEKHHYNMVLTMEKLFFVNILVKFPIDNHDEISVLKKFSQKQRKIKKMMKFTIDNCV